jgi:hypothetical protein
LKKNNNNYITSCISNEYAYLELEHKTKEIVNGRNEDFVKNQRKNEKLKAKVENYYKDVIPEGMSLSQWKVFFWFK